MASGSNTKNDVGYPLQLLFHLKSRGHAEYLRCYAAVASNRQICTQHQLTLRFIFTLLNIMSDENISETHSLVEDELNVLQQNINEYRKALNSEGVWLFLATLGCWSVTNLPLQLASFLLALVVFGDQMAKRYKESRSFSNMVQDLEKRISISLPEGDSQKARLYDLAIIKQKEMSTLNSLKNTRVFLLCWLFWGASLVYTFAQFP